MLEETDLIFAILANHVELISQEKIIEAGRTCASCKDKSLAQFMLEDGVITEKEKAIIEGLVTLTLEKSDGDINKIPRESL